MVFLALGVALPGLAAGDSVALGRPSPATCVTGADALYSVQNGALHAVRGDFMIFPPGGIPFRPLVSAASDGQPGQLLRMYAWSAEPLDSLTAEIGVVQADKPDKPLLRVHGFRYGALRGVQVWMVL
ncbi:MAG TPA: hypothetical protein VL359_08925, partial [bacterium]|nr:hypothetical protein [bacterium]